MIVTPSSPIANWQARVDHRLAVRLMGPGFTERERVILAHVFDARFGPWQSGSVLLVPGVMARRTGIHPNHVREAIRSLKAANVIVEAPDGGVSLVADVDLWSPRNNRQARLWSAGEQHECVAEQTEKGLENKPQSVSPRKPQSVEKQTEKGLESNPNRLENKPQSVSPRARAELNSIQEEEKETKAQIQLNSRGEVSDQEIPPIPDPATSVWYLHGGAQTPTPAEVAELWEVSHRLFGDTNIPWEVWSHHKWHPVACWIAALRESKRRKPDLESWRYIEKTASGYAANGPPAEAPTVTAPGSTPGGYAPRQSAAARDLEKFRREMADTTVPAWDADWEREELEHNARVAQQQAERDAIMRRPHVRIG